MSARRYRGDFGPRALELVGRLAPGLHLGGGDNPEGGLLLVDLRACAVEVGFHFHFEVVPSQFQLRLRALPSCFACFSLLLRMA